MSTRILFSVAILIFSCVGTAFFASREETAKPVAERVIVCDFRCAEEKDLPFILDLFAKFDEADRRRLLVPAPRDREAILMAEIVARRMFVAFDTSGILPNPIIGFCKHYIMSSEEAVVCVRDELCAVDEIDAEEEAGDVYRPKTPRESAIYKISRAVNADYAARLVPVGEAAPFDFRPKKDLFFYLGTNYIVPHFRGKGFDTALERYAFSQVASLDILPACLAAGGKIYYVYGVVEENAASQGRMRSFANFLFLLESVPVDTEVVCSFQTFPALKPAVVLRTSESALRTSPLGSPGVLVRTLSSGSLSERHRRGSLEEPTSPLTILEPAVAGRGCFIGYERPAPTALRAAVKAKEGAKKSGADETDEF